MRAETCSRGRARQTSILAIGMATEKFARAVERHRLGALYRPQLSHRPALSGPQETASESVFILSMPSMASRSLGQELEVALSISALTWRSLAAS